MLDIIKPFPATQGLREGPGCRVVFLQASPPKMKRTSVRNNRTRRGLSTPLLLSHSSNLTVLCGQWDTTS